MSNQKRAGWIRVVLWLAAGSAALVVLLAVLAGASLYWANSTAERLGDPTPVSVTGTVRTGPMTGASTAQSSRGIHVPGVGYRATLGDQWTRRPTRLDIDLEERAFTIQPGPAGSEVKVEGAYADNYYELVQEFDPGDEETGGVITVRLQPKASFLVRMMGELRQGGSDRPPNELTVTIPADLPVDLSLRISKGQSRTDLGGLSLTGLVADLSLGEHLLEFTEPVARVIDRASVSSRYSEMEIGRLGNVRAREIHTSTRMGEFTVDLAGDWVADQVAELSMEHGLGELKLAIPQDIRVAQNSQSSASLAGVEGSLTDDTAGPGAPHVRLDVSTRMGGTQIRRY